MIAKSPSTRIRTSSATSPLIVAGFATSLRYSALLSSEPSGVETMKSSAKISSRRFTSPFCTDATKSRFRAVSVSRSRCAFTFVCMAISSGVRRFPVQLRNEALIFDPQEFDTDWDFAIRAMIRVPDDSNYARHFLSTGYPDAQASNRSAFADRSAADRRPQRAVRRLDHFPSLDGGVRRTRADIPDKRYPFGFDTMARNCTVPVFGSASGPIKSSFAG